MFSIHIDEVKESRLVRAYEKGSYGQGSPYVAVATLVELDANTIVVEGLCGRFNREFMRLLYRQLKTEGYSFVKIKRKGKWLTCPL